MKKLTVQNIIVNGNNNETLTIVSLEFKNEKYILYSSSISNPTINSSLFNKLEFNEILSITPKKKLTELGLSVVEKNRKYHLTYKNIPVYSLINNNNIVLNDTFLKPILSNGKLYEYTIQHSTSINLVDKILGKKSNDEENIKIINFKENECKEIILDKNDNNKTIEIIEDINIDIINEQNTKVIEEKNIEIIEKSNIEVIEESNIEVIKEPNVEVIEETNIETIEKSNIEVIEESNIEVIKEPNVEVIEETNIETIEKSNIEIIEKSNIEVIEESNIEVIEETNIETIEKPNIEVIEETNIETIEKPNIEVIEKHNTEVIEVIKNNEIIQETNITIIEKPKNEIIEEYKTQVNKKEIPENIKEEVFNLATILSDFNKLFNFGDKQENKQENKKESKQELKEEPKKESKQELKEEPKKELKQELKEEPKKELKQELKQEIKPIIKNNEQLIYQNIVNYQNINYKINTIKLYETENLNIMNLNKTEINKLNYVIKNNIAIELKKENASYLFYYMNHKYLINKINNSIVLTNMLNRNSTIIKNKDTFKLENNDYMLYNDCTILIPMINKKIFDNNYGVTFNYYIPKIQ